MTVSHAARGINNVRETRRGNQKGSIQRQVKLGTTQKEKKQEHLKDKQHKHHRKEPEVDPGAREVESVIKYPTRNLDFLTTTVQDSICSNGHFQAFVFVLILK